MSKLMKTCWSWLFVTLLAFTGASALADTTLPENAVKIVDGFYQSAATYAGSADFYITDVEGLKYFRDMINADANGATTDYLTKFPGAAANVTQFYSATPFNGKVIHLLADIDLKGAGWTPIGLNKTRDGTNPPYDHACFSAGAVFDGHDHVISNLSFDDASCNAKFEVGFFGHLNNATVRNVRIENVDINANRFVGSLIGNAGTSAATVISNCHVSGSISLKGNRFLGGLVGHGQYFMTNCSVIATSAKGTVEGSVWQIGGLAGTCRPSTIVGCTVSNLIVKASDYAYVGGIIGHLIGTVFDCKAVDVEIVSEGASKGQIAGNCGDDSEYATTVSYVLENSPKAAGQCGTTVSSTVAGWNISGDLVSGGVTAGTFEALPDSYVASGYVKLAQGTTPETWVIGLPPPVAKIGEQEFRSMAEAYAVAKAGDTVTILLDAVDDIAGIPAGVTVEGVAGKTTVAKAMGSPALDSVTLKNIKFVNDGNTFEWPFVKAEFKLYNCEFDQHGSYGLKIDGPNGGTIYAEGCIFRSTTAISQGNPATFKNCQFLLNSYSGDYDLSLFTDTTLEGCSFVADYTTPGRGIYVKSDNIVIDLKNCSIIDSDKPLTDLFSRRWLKGYSKGLGVVDGVKDGSGKFTSGTFFAGTVAALNANVATSIQLNWLGNCRCFVYDPVAGTVDVQGDVAGSIVVPDVSKFTISSASTFTEGAKIYLPLAEGSEAFNAWKAANVPAAQAANVTVFGYAFEIYAGETLKACYHTLASAVAAVQDGETIKVLKSGNVVTGYAKKIGEEGYSEANGANRLVFGVEGAFTLDLNGKELCGRLNFTKGSMTVANGTIRASSQALNIYGSKAYTEEPYTTITLAKDAVVRASYGFAIFGGDPSNGYWPLGFGETVNIYGKVYAPSPVFVSGNVGMDTYTENIVVQQEIEDLKTAKGKSISQMMLEHGPVINVYEGAELGSSPEAGSTDDSPQGISMQGCTTVNVYGGKISGAEAIGVKGGCLNVTGGTLLGTGPKCDPIAAINSGTESSGGAISVSTFYNANYPIVVNVTGGMIKSANNAALVVAHSYSGKTPTPVVQGISLTVAGGTFIGGADEEAIAVEESVAADAAGKWPANFMWPEMNGTAETGYPLCSSKILPRYIAAGYVEKDNQNGTWTVTAGSPEIKVVDNDFTAKYEKDETVTDAEAQTAANEVKDEIKETLKDPSVSDVIGTGVNESTKSGDQLRTDVVEALKAAAPADQKDQITVDSTTTSFVEIKLDDIKVSVTSTQEEGQPKVIEKTLTAITYEVKPIVTTITKSGDVETTVKAVIPAGAVLAKPITFRLWLDETFVSDAVEVTHKSSLTDETPIDVKTYLVQTEEGKRYIDLTWNQFSYAILKSTSTGEKACLVDGTLYDTVADALAASIPTDATITLLKDCGETGLALGNDRTLALNGHAFTGSLAMDAGKEMVKTKADTIYVAPEAVKVPTSGTASLPIRGFTFPGDVTTDEAKKAYLAADDTNGRPRWQNYILGTSVKLVPEIVGAAEGFSTVVIKAATGWTMTTPAKAGVAVKFNLVKKDAGDGAFAQYGSTSDTPHFQVNVNDIGPKTFWKIQTMFESTEAE